MGRAIKLVLYYFAYQLAFTFLVGLPAGIIKVMNEISENDNLAYAAGKNTASMTGLVMVLAGIAMIWHLIYFKYVQFNKTSWTEVPAKTILLSIPFIIAAMFICNVASEFIELPNLVEDTFIGMSRNVFGIIAIGQVDRQRSFAFLFVDEFLLKFCLFNYSKISLFNCIKKFIVNLRVLNIKEISPVFIIKGYCSSILNSSFEVVNRDITAESSFCNVVIGKQRGTCKANF